MVSEDAVRRARSRRPRQKDHWEAHCNLVREVIRQDWDWWTSHEGYEGTGKSTGSIWTALRVGRELFNVGEHVVYEPLEILRMVDDAPRYGVIVVDEAGEAIFNRDFNSQLNKAIIKASQQCRDRNLFFELNLPTLELLDTKLIRRFKTHVIYEAPEFIRGKSIWHSPSKGRYERRSIPFFRPTFYYWFQDLQEPVRSAYREVKTRKGKERLQGYIEDLKDQEDKHQDVDPRKIVDRIRRRSDREVLLTSKGTWSRDKIRYEYQLPESLARQVVAGLELEAEA